MNTTTQAEVFALTSHRGTAMAETAYCDAHLTPDVVQEALALTAGERETSIFRRIHGNPEIACNRCGVAS